ncbi:fas apoptotic inhibitory molecule 1 [Agrilus planipennis]|uniref:Fas apoptotic inhibitory molecule 1 n=1 Tax=Agrilus planipennis TaxID=224129 RepID=A0A7F5RL53_AGRPL|nr:fas apoptotic inhibitory molecule 1 [Agrilus planipennis]
MAKKSNNINKISKNRNDLVAFWSVPLPDGTYSIEFEHGTTSGKRILRINGKEILRRDWMFRLVGDEIFEIGKQKAKCVLSVDPLPYFSFCYGLSVNGKPLEKFTEKQNKNLKVWIVTAADKEKYRIVLEKQNLNVWINGNLQETINTFIDNGTEIRFKVDDFDGVIKATSATKKGLVYELYGNGQLIPDENEF